MDGADTAAIKMTHSDDIGKLKELCQRLAENDVIASRPELPKLFNVLGRVIERQCHDIESLKAKVSKHDLQRESTVASAVDTEQDPYEQGGDAECPPRQQI
jgi:hypothetical protein